MTKSAALEAARYGVRVNAVAPGPTDTGMLTRFTGAPENKAALVAAVEAPGAPRVLSGGGRRETEGQFRPARVNEGQQGDNR
jgi:NAD(P)-dependent dehydrogenase (short-subunit alcohol dehydrogenase family)